MKKINVLSKNVYNRIAAGEVIDRPYSAVKELIENSLDAHSTEIEIYIENGGKQLIKIIDNGSGIERDDLCDAFTPHATSKISKAEDLDKITTLGFRGEALASISVISKVELISITEGNSAYKICCEDGVVGDITPAALEQGTQITVRDLFYNTPARAKFLKTDKKEEADITNFVTRYILGNPNVAFKYFVDGKLILQSFGGGLDEAVAQVYGAKTLSQCYKIEAQKGDFKISGFIGNQNFFKANKTYQSIFLNGRYIINNTISTAINNAYINYMMKRQYPFYVLNVEVPCDFVDVNVHPNKADVRFVDNRTVYSAIYSVIAPVLDGTAKATEFVISETRIPEIKSTSETVDNLNKVYSQPLTNENKYEKFSPKLDNILPTVKVIENGNSDFLPTALKHSVKENKMSVTDDTMLPNLDNFKAYEIQKEYFGRKKDEQQKIDYKAFKYRTSLFDTYLMYEVEDSIYIIDQHAAHERLIYDKLCKDLKNREIIKQPMLFPYIFTVNSVESQFLDSNIKILRAIGLGIAPFGYGSYRVDEVPVDLQNINIKNFFEEILSQINSLKNIDVEDVLKDRLAMTACKHAIKGGMRLTEQEVDKLFEMLDGNLGLKCPHGRPVCVKLTKKDIEKMFKRIV